MPQSLRLRLARASGCALARRTALAAACIFIALPPSARGQSPAIITLDDARLSARRHSAEVLAAREAVAAARGRERQASAFPNPVLAYDTEQTSGGGQSNSQHIASFEQPLELRGIRAARTDVAVARRLAAELRLTAAEAELDFTVSRAYALALSADRRAELANDAANAFTDAVRVSTTRLASGDISGYTARRLKLEAARYAAIRAEAQLARRAARLALTALIAPSVDAIGRLPALDLAALPLAPMTLPLDSLLALSRARAEVRVSLADADAALAEARLVRRERTPSPTIVGGMKTEQQQSSSSTGSQGLFGFAAGISIPLPLWDRRAGATDAADAEARRRAAETEALRRRVVREVAGALDAFRSAEEQIAALAPQLGAESRTALRSAQVAYTEGEISLVEWLDTVRAYREAEASFAGLQADALVQRAALERAVGHPLNAPTSGGGARVVPSPNQDNR